MVKILKDLVVRVPLGVVFPPLSQRVHVHLARPLDMHLHVARLGARRGQAMPLCTSPPVLLHDDDHDPVPPFAISIDDQ